MKKTKLSKEEALSKFEFKSIQQRRNEVFQQTMRSKLPEHPILLVLKEKGFTLSDLLSASTAVEDAKTVANEFGKVEVTTIQNHALLPFSLKHVSKTKEVAEGVFRMQAGWKYFEFTEHNGSLWIYMPGYWMQREEGSFTLEVTNQDLQDVLYKSIFDLKVIKNA